MESLLKLNNRIITKFNLDELSSWYVLLSNRQSKYHKIKTKKIESEIDFIQKQLIRLTKNNSNS